MADTADYKEAYEKEFGCTLQNSDITKQWADCWIGGTQLGIIHIDNPHNRTVSFDYPQHKILKSLNTYTTEVLNGYAELSDDQWYNITNVSELSIGEDAYIECYNSDTSQTVYFRVRITGFDNDSIKTINYG